MMAMPYRSQLMVSLGNGVDRDTLRKDIEEHHRLLKAQVDTIKQLYEEKELGSI